MPFGALYKSFGIGQRTRRLVAEDSYPRHLSVSLQWLPLQSQAFSRLAWHSWVAMRSCSMETIVVLRICLYSKRRTLLLRPLMNSIDTQPRCIFLGQQRSPNPTSITHKVAMADPPDFSAAFRCSSPASSPRSTATCLAHLRRHLRVGIW